MAQARIGLIGLGVMGANLALNIAENGFPVAVYNRTTERIYEFIDGAGDLAPRLVGAKTPEALVAALTPPRAIIIMVKAGVPVDASVAAILRATCPDLPIPAQITRPVTPRTRSTAFENRSSMEAARRSSPSRSSSITRRAEIV